MWVKDEDDLATAGGLIGCPRCDALHVRKPGERLRCSRCAKLLASPLRAGALVALVVLSLTSMALMTVAVFLPFIEVSRLWFGNTTSLFGVAMAFAEGWQMPLVLAVLAMIVGLPLLRAALLVFVLAPLAAGRPAFGAAAAAFRLSEAIRPWSMAEIFAIGTFIALVKLAGMANVSLGPAFWAFCALIPVSVGASALTWAAMIWNAIEGGEVRTATPIAGHGT